MTTATTDSIRNKDIFDFLFHDGSEVSIRGIQQVSRRDSWTHDYTLDDYTQAHDGVDLYYAPNGAFNKKDIKQLRAVWVDLDAPKHEGEYASEDLVREFKRTALQKIKSCPAPTTYYTETRNGYQALWAINPVVDSSVWSTTMTRITQWFDSDDRVLKENNLLRVPNSAWYKSSHGLPPFEIRCIEFNRVRYDIEDLNQSFQGEDLTFEPPDDGFTDSPPISDADQYAKEVPVDSIDLSPSTSTDDNSSPGRTRRKLIQEEIRKHSHPDLPNGKCLCPFHDDKRPSAMIHRDGALTCFAEKRTYYAVEVHANRNECSVLDSVINLVSEYSIDAPGLPTEVLISVRDRINNNLAMVQSIYCECESVTETTFRLREATFIRFLTAVHETALQSFDVNEIFDFEGNPTVMTPTREIANRLGVSDSLVRKYIRTSALLGFIRPMPVRELPRDIINRWKQWKARKGVRSIPFYLGIPDYASEDWKALHQERLAILSEHRITQRMLSFDALHIIVGHEIALYVYPEPDPKGPRRARADRMIICDLIDQALLSDGYIRETDLIRNFSDRLCIPYEKAKKEWKYNRPLITIRRPDLEFRQLTDEERSYLDVSWTRGQAAIVCAKGIDITQFEAGCSLDESDIEAGYRRLAMTPAPFVSG